MSQSPQNNRENQNSKISASKQFTRFLTQSPNLIKNKSMTSSLLLEKEQNNSQQLVDSQYEQNNEEIINKQIDEKTSLQDENENVQPLIKHQQVQGKAKKFNQVGSFFNQSREKVLTKSSTTFSSLSNKLKQQTEEERLQQDIQYALLGKNESNQVDPLNSADFTYSMDVQQASNLIKKTTQDKQLNQQQKKDINWNEQEEILPEEEIKECQSILVTANENLDHKIKQRKFQKIQPLQKQQRPPEEELVTELTQAKQEKSQLENQLSKINQKIKNLRVKLKPIQQIKAPQSLSQRPVKLLSPIQRVIKQKINEQHIQIQNVNENIKNEHLLLKERLKFERQQQILSRLKEKKLLKDKQQEMKQQSQQFLKHLYKHPYYQIMDWKGKHGVGKARYIMAGDESHDGSSVGIEGELKKLKDYQNQIQELDQYIEEQQVPDLTGRQTMHSALAPIQNSSNQQITNNQQFQQYYSPQGFANKLSS